MQGIELLPAPPSVAMNGKAKPVKTAEAGLSKVDAICGRLSDEVKANILNLANAATT